MPKVVSLKAAELRKRGYVNVEQWLSNPKHLYIGREMRVFIYTNISTKELPSTKVAYDYSRNEKYLIRPKKSNQAFDNNLLQCMPGSYVNNNHTIVKRFLIPQSKWHNPFRVKDFNNQAGATIDHFTKYFESNESLMSSLNELSNYDEIGCWCKPNPCHGDTILKFYHKWKFNQKNNDNSHNNNAKQMTTVNDNDEKKDYNNNSNNNSNNGASSNMNSNYKWRAKVQGQQTQQMQTKNTPNVNHNNNNNINNNNINSNNSGVSVWNLKGTLPQQYTEKQQKGNNYNSNTTSYKNFNSNYPNARKNQNQKQQQQQRNHHSNVKQANIKSYFKAAATKK